MWVQTPWGVFEVKNSFFMYNTIFVYILRVSVSMKGSKGHQKSRTQRKQTGFKELAHICVLCSAIASPSLLSSSPIRVNPSLGYTTPLDPQVEVSCPDQLMKLRYLKEHIAKWKQSCNKVEISHIRG